VRNFQVNYLSVSHKINNQTDSYLEV